MTGGSPAGGSYSGTGVSGGMFDPGVSGVGTFEITYSYSDGNGCNNFISQSLQVTNCSGCTASISPAGPTTFCDGGSVVLNSSAGFHIYGTQVQHHKALQHQAAEHIL